MPVYKFKTFQEARDAQLIIKTGENYYKMLSGFYETFGKIFTLKFPHGIYKFKSIEEAQKQKENWIFSRNRKYL